MIFICYMEIIYYIVASLFYLSAVAGICWFIYNLREVYSLEEQIEKKYSEMEENIKQSRNRPVMQSIIDGEIQKIEKKYNPEIKRLERRRRHILDKLPFFGV